VVLNFKNSNYLKICHRSNPLKIKISANNHEQAADKVVQLNTMVVRNRTLKNTSIFLFSKVI